MHANVISKQVHTQGPIIYCPALSRCNLTTNYGVTVWIPSQIEATVALIGASIPAIHPLYKSIFIRFIDKVTNRSSSGDPLSHSGFAAHSNRGGSGAKRNVKGGKDNFHRLNESQVELQPLSPMGQFSQ